MPKWRGPDDDDELIRRARRSNSPRAIFGDGASFDDLWTASEAKLAKAFPSAHDVFDRSGADQALANRLAFWTGSNHERMLTLMRSCEALARDKWDRPDYLRRTILEACAKQTNCYVERAKEPAAEPTVTEDDPREVILLSSGKLNQYAAQAEGLMANALYVHGDSLVRIGRAAEISNATLLDASGTKRDAAQAVCIPASSAWLRRELMERARFFKYDKRARDWELKDCPKELADNIVDQEAWSSFHTLTAITSVPILRPDMSVWTQPGYDPVTRVYYQPTTAIPPIPAAPTRDDAVAAIARLREPFNQFPYAADVSEAVFLSHILTSVLRASFDTSPIYCYTSPIAATGKTLLSEMAQRVATGMEPAQSPFSEDEELRKVLFASLLAGDASIIFDNLSNGVKVRAPELCRFVTSATYSDRVLGASKKRQIPNRCTVVLTGNNITPVSDLARRSLCCRLDVNSEALGAEPSVSRTSKATCANAAFNSSSMR
jgi:putative DNA primase/helicase